MVQRITLPQFCNKYAQIPDRMRAISYTLTKTYDSYRAIGVGTHFGQTGREKVRRSPLSNAVGDAISFRGVRTPIFASIAILSFRSIALLPQRSIPSMFDLYLGGVTDRAARFRRCELPVRCVY